MAEQDTRAFLEDVLLRYDPTIDITDGSSAQVELIDPILQRIGPDPFSGDIVTFIRDRLRAAFPDMALTPADEAEDLLVRPMQVLIEPIVQEIKLIQLRSRLDNYLQLSDAEVDAQMGNFFEGRQRGGLARGSVRLYFNSPQTVSISVVHVATAPGELRFIPDRPQQITSQQMSLNIEGAEYYFDVDYVAQRRGIEFNVNENTIRSVANLPGAVRVRNLRKFRGGVARETSTEFVARVEQGRHDGSLATEPGALSRLQRTFPEIQKMQVIGFGDIEMERDILRGGSFSGPIPDDGDGPLYGTAGPSDDLDGDGTTTQLSTVDGHFVARVGGEGDRPDSWYMLITYMDGGAKIVRNAKIQRVISSDVVELDLDGSEEIPISLGPTDITWMLQTRTITIGGIPGGITTPTTPEGTILVKPDEVHIGGHVDYYVAGPIEETYAQIEGLSDESPVVHGIAASTTQDSPNIVVDPGTDMTKIKPGMSFILKEGAGAGAYTIIAVVEMSETVVVDVDLSEDQTDAVWVVSGEIEVNLMDPQEPKISGDDLRAVANSPVVTTVGSTNFDNSNVQIGDVLEIVGVTPTEHAITNTTPLLLTIDPPAPRTYSSVAYRVFRRSDSIDAPIVRIRSMEILDSDNAPVGAEIPPRDPVLVLSRSFNNEGSGTIFDGDLTVGLVTSWSSAPNVSSKTLEWESWDAAVGSWSSPESGTISFLAGTAATASAIAARLNSTGTNFSTIFGSNVASVMSVNGISQVAISSVNKMIVFTGGTALTDMAFSAPGQIASNAQIRLELGQFYARKDVRLGDLVQVIGTKNQDVRARIASDTTVSAPEVVQTTLGPLPKGRADSSPIYTLQIGPCPTYIPEKARVVIGRPSVGSARVFFEKPTSVEFEHVTSRFTTEVNGGVLEYRPDPGNVYQISPAYPETALSQGGSFSSTLNGPSSLINTSGGVGFLSKGVVPGDTIQVSYRDILSSANITNLAPMKGKKLYLSVGNGTPVEVVFPSPTTLDLDTVVDTINTVMGRITASKNLAGNRIILNIDDKLSVATGTESQVTTGLHISIGETNLHPYAGEYTVFSVSSLSVDFVGDGIATYSDLALGKTSRYRVFRNTQRISSTQMSGQQDSSGTYYADVELISTAPGDAYNVGSDNIFEVTGYKSDGYRLRALESTNTYSAEEILYADVTPTVLLPGSSDSIQDTLRLTGQNVQVNYDRSQLVEDVHGYITSKYNRHVGMNPLARHLLPHYVNLHWHYVGGAAESDVLRYLKVAIDSAATDTEFEINDLVGKMKELRAASVFVKDTSLSTGRRAPIALVVYHDQSRRVRARIVSDFLRTSRLQRFIPGNVRVTRTATSI